MNVTFTNAAPLSQLSQTPQVAVTPTPVAVNPQATNSSAMSPDQMLQAMQQMLQSATATANVASPNPQTATTTASPEDILAQQFETLIEKFGKLFGTVFDGTVNNAVKEMAQQTIAEVNKNKALLVKENVIGKLSELLAEAQKLLTTNKNHIEEILARFIQVAKESMAQSPFIHMLRTGLAADPHSALQSFGVPGPNN